MVLGDALAARLVAQKAELSGIEIVGAFRAASEFDKKAKALAPEVLLLDEPSLGLAPIVVHAIFEAIEEIHLSYFRAGADIVITYHAKDAARWLQQTP